MTVAMSAHDYNVLVDAVRWIEQHAGNDAPEYPQIEKLSRVVNSIAKRRPLEDEPRPGSNSVVDLRGSSSIDQTFASNPAAPPQSPPCGPVGCIP